MNSLYRADLHVHSNFSDKPSFWAIRKLNCPESYTSPEFIYNTAKKMGMDYVTITDHDTINGVLEIAHLPGVFISAEVNTYFPENGCKIHVIALDISEDIFKEIMGLRKNVYELVAYLRKAGMVHFIAHPLFDLNGRLSVATIEKMLLLFNVFEVKNGIRAERFNKLIKDIISSLTKEKLDALSDKHNITPYGGTPWKKAVVGGSDDHSGFFIARSYTASPEGRTLKDFISSVRECKTWAAGKDGDPLTLAHNIYGIGYRFYRERIDSGKNNSMPFVNSLLSRFFKIKPEKISLGEKIKLFIRKNMPATRNNYHGKTFEEILDREAERLINDRELLGRFNAEDRNRSIFAVISHLANRMVYIYANQLMKLSFSNGIFQTVQSLGTLGIIHFLTSPYYVTHYYQHRSKRLMKELKESFLLPDSDNHVGKIAIFTDTVNEINGVAVAIKRLRETAKNRGIDLTVITCSNEETSFKDGIKNFKSVGDFALPEYPELKLHFPPILDVIDYVEREGFTRIQASTPGTLGLLAISIAKLMDIPISATYYTDIPQYVMSLTNDVFLENTAWNYMVWFYNQMENILVPSKSTQDQIIEKGLPPEKIRLLPKWVDIEIFCPQRRNPRIWDKYNMDGKVKFLYVGRLSKEKNLGLLADAFINIIKAGFRSYLVIVGDGPYRDNLENKLEGYPVLFTGFLIGEELSTLYASSDVFVFPSATDTYGNVVLEAQASGLPVVVSDEGGPKELMIHNETGYVVKANDRTALVNTLVSLIKNREKIKIMGERARHFVETHVKSPEDMCLTTLRS
ncbi:MAG: glycosyltransferase [Candidatus Brocadia sp.]|nr:glycosyltransferase [Candidatus Brocadia sp.]